MNDLSFFNITTLNVMASNKYKPDNLIKVDKMYVSFLQQNVKDLRVILVLRQRGFPRLLLQIFMNHPDHHLEIPGILHYHRQNVMIRQVQLTLPCVNQMMKSTI